MTLARTTATIDTPVRVRIRVEPSSSPAYGDSWGRISCRVLMPGRSACSSSSWATSRGPGPGPAARPRVPARGRPARLRYRGVRAALRP